MIRIAGIIKLAGLPGSPEPKIITVSEDGWNCWDANTNNIMFQKKNDIKRKTRTYITVLMAIIIMRNNTIIMVIIK